MPVAIDFSSVWKGVQDRWRRRWILHELGFQVQEGSVVGLVGHNGAGKSSSIRLMVGASWPTRGQVQVFGGSPADPKTRRHIGFSGEHAALPRTLTARELVALHCGLLGLPGKDVDEALHRSGFRVGSRQHVGSYSKGMAQRLSLTLATLGSPRLLLLDEPMSGLDPVGRANVRQLILDERARGATIVFSSHVLSDVAALCDRLLVLREGRLVLDEPVQGAASPEWRITLAGAPGALPEGLPARQDPGDPRALLVPSNTDVWAVCQRLEAAGLIIVGVANAQTNLEARVLPLLEHQDDG